VDFTNHNWYFLDCRQVGGDGMIHNQIAKYFGFSLHRTSYRKEIIGGVTTFVTMAYVLILNPKILESAGIPVGPSLVATIFTAFIGTLAMGIYARRPFAVAPYMGENAFIAYTVVQTMGYSWQTALGAVFVGGVVFMLISLAGLRSWLAESVPNSLKAAFAVGIGLFLAFIGLNHTGIVALGVEGSPVKVGDLSELSVILAIVCFLLIAALSIRKISGAMLIAILTVTAVAFVSGVATVPDNIASLPPSLDSIFLKLDIVGALSWGFASVVFTVLMTDFIDTTGTLLGLAYCSGMLDEHGNLPEIEKPMLCDSMATVVGALCGTTTAGTYLESAAGIEAGGKTGFSAVITALLFLLALFFAPVLTAVPSCAYGAAVVFVGLLMLAPIATVKFDDLTEVIPAFAVIVLMSFTMNLGIGLTAGLLAHPIVKVLAGRAREVKKGAWLLGILSGLFLVLYPY
jgi:AGZA family xanthine/uracil permease-like MFS transporter